MRIQVDEAGPATLSDSMTLRIMQHELLLIRHSYLLVFAHQILDHLVRQFRSLTVYVC